MPVRDAEVKRGKLCGISSLAAHLIDLSTAILIPNQAPTERDTNLGRLVLKQRIIDETKRTWPTVQRLHSIPRRTASSNGTDQIRTSPFRNLGIDQRPKTRLLWHDFFLRVLRLSPSLVALQIVGFRKGTEVLIFQASSQQCISIARFEGVPLIVSEAEIHGAKVV